VDLFHDLPVPFFVEAQISRRFRPSGIVRLAGEPSNPHFALQQGMPCATIIDCWKPRPDCSVQRTPDPRAGLFGGEHLMGAHQSEPIPDCDEGFGEAIDQG
jgi:hypothetical protein